MVGKEWCNGARSWLKLFGSPHQALVPDVLVVYNCNMAFADPGRVIRQLDIEHGMIVADLGSGAGYYTVLLADKVGREGKVYAIDIQSELLTKAKTLDGKKRDNIEFLQGDLEKEKGTHLAENTLDMACMVNVLFQLSNKEAALREAFRILKRGGTLFLSDWSDSFGGIGPQPEYVVSFDATKHLAEAIGFSFDKTVEVGDHHWGAVFVK